MKKQKDKGKKISEKLTEKKNADKISLEDAPTASTFLEAAVPTTEASNTIGSAAPNDIQEACEDEIAVVDPETPSKPPHNRQPSLSLQSKIRSSSFRRTSIPQTPLSPTTNGNKPLGLPALSPDGDAVTEIYRKQAFRLDELEKENKKLLREVETAESRWRKTEEELEELRENSGQVAHLKSRAEKADATAEEVNRLVSQTL